MIWLLLVVVFKTESPYAAQALGQGSKESLLGGQREGSMGECTLLAAPVEEQNSVPSI